MRLIDADALGKNLQKLWDIHDDTDFANKDVWQELENAPTIDAVKHGRWVPGRKIGKEILTDGTIAVVYEDYKCSSCGLILFRLLHNIDGTPFYKFCPNCGADMRGAEE